MCEAARTAKTAQSAATTNGGTCSWVSTCTGPSQPSRGGSKNSIPRQLEAKDMMIHVGATNHCSRLTTAGTGSPDRTHTSTARTVSPSNPAMPPPGIARSRSIAGQVSSQTPREAFAGYLPSPYSPKEVRYYYLLTPQKYLDLLPTRGSGERVYDCYCYDRTPPYRGGSARHPLRELASRSPRRTGHMVEEGEAVFLSHRPPSGRSAIG